TLEQKISDAGPFNQRIDPHIITTALRDLVQEGVIYRMVRGDTYWYYLANESETHVQRRLAELESIYTQLRLSDITLRVGQALEIAVYRALFRQSKLEFFGQFLDLDQHDDSQRYRKVEPPSQISGRTLAGNQKFDFLVRHPSAGWGGVEVKNIRQWIYPDHEDIKELLSKCLQLDCVPILIARRIHFLTFKLFSTCGVIVHQTYNQRLPLSERELASKAKDKRLLGYHDIRLGNEPDARLNKFISVDLPAVLPEARIKFDEHKEVLENFVTGTISHQEFIKSILPQSVSIFEEYL
ncbi:MAG: hypothetical protein QXS68_05255, partial [Candidatus Methanomethylicaceae archaeon]